MKKITVILFLCISTITGYSQNEIFDYYVGSWRWENPQTGESFIVTLKKGSHKLNEYNGGGTEECIIGAYKYIKNNIVIIDKSSELEKIYDNSIRYPIWADIPSDSTYTVYFIVQDYEKTNSYGEAKVMGGDGVCRLEYVSSSPKRIRWDLTRVDTGGWDELWAVDERQIFPEGTSLPTNIILTKVE